MEQGLVSVIIPTYKGSDVIKRAVDSVLNQTYSKLEIIIVDDNNPDSEERKATERIMSLFSDEARVVYLKHDNNKNGAAARNTGIVYSSGEYIAFLDADDWFLPEKIERQVEFLQSHKEFDACYCLAQRNHSPIQTTPYEGRVTKELLLMQTNMFTPSLLFRSFSLKQINGFDETYNRHQDYELLLRFFREGFSIGCVCQILLELGTSENRNSVAAEKLLYLKNKYLLDFKSDIDALDCKDTGIKNKIYALHYGKVFLAYILERKYRKAADLLKQYFWCSPYYFFKSFLDRCRGYLRRKLHI